MPDGPVVTRTGSQGQAVGWAGADAGKAFAGDDELARKAFEQQFSMSYPGASGIAGGSVRATSTYKSALENAWMSQKALKALAPLQQASGNMGQVLGTTGAMPGNEGDALMAKLLQAFSQPQGQ